MKKWIIGILIIFVGIQFIPVDRSNPPVKSDIPAPLNVKQILIRSCYDCHSNQTQWPLYSYIAPISVYIARDVEEGRDELNFSEWEKYDLRKKFKKLDEVVEEIEEGKMPPRQYIWLHPDAKITPEDLDAIRFWVESYRLEMQRRYFNY